MASGNTALDRLLQAGSLDWRLIGAGCLLILAVLAGALWLRLALAATAFLLGFLAWRSWQARPQAAPAPAAPATPLASNLGELTRFLEALPDAALLVGPDGKIVGSNMEARRQLQFEASGLRLSAIMRQPDVLDAVEAAVADGATRAVEYSTGVQVEEYFRVYVAPVAWAGQVAALMIFHDQTARIMSERLRADFLANASHELKTPVTALSMMIETLSGPARDDATVRDRFFGLMQFQVQKMRRLIEDLLSLSKIELDEHVPPSDRADLAAVVGEAADALVPIARQREVTIAFQPSAQDVYIIGDRFQMAQVAQNLIDNAIKYSPVGGMVRIELGLAASRENAADLAGRQWTNAARIALLTPPPQPLPREYAVLRVSDGGRGISRRYLPRLSERFFRVERESSGDKSGTGLGLAIVRHIVSRHRGGFMVESEEGFGSAFSVYFPRIVAPVAKAAE
jgi:two-component system phosphate regulon sensor histidine kinase PhoR